MGSPPHMATCPARNEDDPRRRLAIVVTNAARVAAPTAPLKQVMRDAAATEPAIREIMDEDESRRLATQRELLAIVLDRPPSPAAIAGVYTLVNSDASVLVAERLGWSEERWRRWLVDVLSGQLLGP